MTMRIATVQDRTALAPWLLPRSIGILDGIVDGLDHA
jgi:hypothetical protein